MAYHITQHGTARQFALRTRADCLVYLDLPSEQAAFAEVVILACCLMSNHIHLIAVPHEVPVLAEVMQRVHGRYAQYLNARRGRCGHLWQNRFNSCPLGASHLWAALRYVEMNPVRAGLATDPRSYEWSSAEAHLSGEDPARIAEMSLWRAAGAAPAWARLLNEPEVEIELKALRRATHSGQPFGDQAFREEMHAQRAMLWAKVAGELAPARDVEVLRARS